MIFPISRAVAIKKLKPEELKDLHEREIKRGFTSPFSNIKSLYFYTLSSVVMPIDGWTDQEVTEYNARIKECMPKPEIYGIEVPTMSCLEFVHEWDSNIYHNMEQIEIHSKESKKRSLMD